MNKEELIFNMKKNTPYRNAREFKGDIIKNLKIKDIDFKDVYAKIINYQIAKYGERLSVSTEVECWKGLGKQKSILSNNRKSKRKNYESKRRKYD